MIQLIEANGHRCLRYVKQRLRRFEVLVGPNASGKSTFLDVVAFLADLLREGPEAAVLKRAPTVEELTWNGLSTRIELAVEIAVPKRIGSFTKQTYKACRHQVGIGRDKATGEIQVQSETFWLKPEYNGAPGKPRRLFPEEPRPPQSILLGVTRTPPGWRKVVNKVADSGNDYFQSETGAWNNQFRIGPLKTALANLPEDETRFPVAIWAKRFLMEGVQTLALNSREMRKPTSPIGPRKFKPDGSNLPVVVRWLQENYPNKHQAWVEHVKTALPDLREVKVLERGVDRYLYLALVYSQSSEVPVWLVSDGTLRMLALTLLAYLPGGDAVYLIEEPENGIHPLGVEVVFQSLSSAYESQVLVASHSPILLGLAKQEHILCFSRTLGGATDIVVGIDHPALREWRGETALSDLYAAGVLG